MKKITLIVICAISVISTVHAQVIISNFGTSATSFGDWVYNSSTSTLTGSEGVGDTLYATSPISVDISGYSQLSFTASVTTAPSAGFVVILEDSSFNTATANFSWTSFSSGGSTVVATLTPALGFDFSDVTGWSLNSGGSGNPINASLGNIQAVPEPGTWALLAGGLTTVVVLRKRRKA